MTDISPIQDWFRLHGKVAVVTGASGGLGGAMAEAVAEAGADLIVASRRRDRLDAIIAYADRLGRVCVPVVCNVEDAEQVRGVIKTAEEKFGRLDILINAAGATHRDPPEDFPESAWDQVLNVNLKSVFVACQEAGRRMIAQRSGKIINVASMLSFTGGLYVPAYAASKGGVAQLTKALANEWARHNVQVNAIAPGYFRTELTKAIYEDPVRSQEILSRIPSARWGEPADLKGAVVFLASAASDYVNGHILAVDGGWLAR
jgi:2-deoxy-D-gluconate 3-dehydrogenase